ncbi:MAG TPA: hypothetical protein VMU19_15005 [Bryobacteraceae bacterium]|nr:hypothetical protein [Bryobacteraceae bacterium]
MKTSHLLVALAAVNALLYAGLLPLWEGFDEPFHFGNVERYALGGGLPRPDGPGLSREVAQSIVLVPASAPVKANLPRATTYSDFFAGPPERRAQLREALRRIPPEYRRQTSDIGDYEAYQAPLAYLLLAVPDRLMGDTPLPTRVLVLRILAGLAGSMLLCGGALAVCREIGLGQPHSSAALFCVLATQMTWATLAHVANDWLAAPLAVWTLAWLLRAAAKPDARRIAAASLVLSAGLLTKAYFLAVAPVVVAVCALRRGWRGLALCAGVVAVCGGPWYARNLRVYGDLTGMPQSMAGVGFMAVFRAAPGVPWGKAILDSARMALWTGNNTGRTFSLVTLDAVIAAAAAALLLWALSRHSRAEWIAAAYCAAFFLAVQYAGVQTLAASRGAATAPSPWYAQTLVAPLLALAMLGAARHRRMGLAAEALLLTLFGYVFVATYAFKLIPLYGGYEGRGSAGQLVELYGRRFPQLAANLGAVTLAPAALVFALTGIAIAVAAALEVRLLRDLAAWARTPRHSEPESNHEQTGSP